MLQTILEHLITILAGWATLLILWLITALVIVVYGGLTGRYPGDRWTRLFFVLGEILSFTFKSSNYDDHPKDSR